MQRRGYLSLVGAGIVGLAGCSTSIQEDDRATPTPTAFELYSETETATPTDDPTATPTEESTPTPTEVPRVRWQVIYPRPEPWEATVYVERTDATLDKTYERSRPMLSHIGTRGQIKWLRIRVAKQTDTDAELTLALDINGEIIATDVAPQGDDAAVLYHSFTDEDVATFTPSPSPTPASGEFTLIEYSGYSEVPTGEPFTLRFRIKNAGDRAATLETTLQYDYDREAGTRWHDVDSFAATIGAGASKYFETDSITLDSEGEYRFRLTNVEMDPVTIAAR